MEKVLNTGVSFFFNTEDVEYAVAWQLAIAPFDISNEKPEPITPVRLQIAMKLLGYVSNSKDGPRKLSSRYLERRTPWTKKTILIVLKLMQSAKLLTLLEGTKDIYILGEAVTDGRMQHCIDRFNASLQAGDQLVWPISSPARDNSRKAKQAKKLKGVRSVEDATKEMELVEEVTGVESSRTPGVKSLEDPSKVGSLEDSRVGSLEDPAKRDIETRQDSFLEINQKLKTKLILDSDQTLNPSPVVQEQVTFAGLSPHSGQPSADLRLERQPQPQPCSAQPQQPEQQKDSSVVLNDSVPIIKVEDNVNYISNKEEELEAIHSIDGVWEVTTIGVENITVETKTLNGWGYYTTSQQRFDGSGLAFVESTTECRNERSINKHTESLLEQIMNKR